MRAERDWSGGCEGESENVWARVFSFCFYSLIRLSLISLIRYLISN